MYMHVYNPGTFWKLYEATLYIKMEVDSQKSKPDNAPKGDVTLDVARIVVVKSCWEWRDAC